MTFNNHDNYNCTITLDNNETFNVAANWLHNNNLDKWNTWHCQAGVMRIEIVEDEVYSGACLNDYLGNLTTGWDLFDNYSVCKQQTCTGCTDDLITLKWRATNEQTN